MFWNSRKHQIPGYVLFNMVIECLNMSSNTSNLQNWNIYPNAFSKKFLCIHFKKPIFCELGNISPFLWVVMHTVRITLEFCTRLKKKLRIWIRSERASRENVLKSLDSYHSVAIHTNVPTSNPSSDTMQCLAILVSLIWWKDIK